jgi:tRNA(Ile)-lysidine synthase
VAQGALAEALHARARGEGLLQANRPVVVLLSGGRDSTCLLEVALAVCGPACVSALHVNYGLRDGAQEDELHCLRHAERSGLALTVHRPGRPRRGNLQAWAREERYRAARELARERGAEVAAGHTASDQVETILYRLASSPSRRALLGMRAREGGLVRPLLTTTREQTTAYCREDPSNDGDAYARSRVRGELVPALRRVHPAAERNVLALAALLREEAEVLDGAVDHVLGGGEEVRLAELRALPVGLARLVLQRLADGAAGGPAPGTARRTEELLALGDQAKLDLPHGVRAVIDRGNLRMERRAREARRGPPRP